MSVNYGKRHLPPLCGVYLVYIKTNLIAFCLFQKLPLVHILQITCTPNTEFVLTCHCHRYNNDQQHNKHSNTVIKNANK